MSHDPGEKRTGITLPHSKGLPALDDAPVHLSAPLQISPVLISPEMADGLGEESASSSAPVTVAYEERARHTPTRVSTREDGEFSEQPDVRFVNDYELYNEDANGPDTLMQGLSPLTSRVDSAKPPSEVMSAVVSTRPFEGSTKPYEPTSARPFELRLSAALTDPPPVMLSDEVLDEPDDAATTLRRDIEALGTLPIEPDREADRPISIRAPLARGRALRFRLSLLEAWRPPGKIAPSGVMDFELSLDCALLVGLSDGAGGLLPEPFTFVRTLVSSLRARRPELSVMTLRERGASTVARLTLVGYRAAFVALEKKARESPMPTRRVALDIAIEVSFSGNIGEKLQSLRDLERGLSLPSGTVADAIHAARARSTQTG